MEDPAIAAVEEILGPSRQYVPNPLRPRRARRALWLCNCFSDDDFAPTWLIHDDDVEGLVWCRVDEGDASRLVEALHQAGDHTEPGNVVDWLKLGSSPWNWDDDHGASDARVLAGLRRQILRSGTTNAEP